MVVVLRHFWSFLIPWARDWRASIVRDLREFAFEPAISSSPLFTVFWTPDRGMQTPLVLGPPLLSLLQPPSPVLPQGLQLLLSALSPFSPQPLPPTTTVLLRVTGNMHIPFIYKWAIDQTWRKYDRCARLSSLKSHSKTLVLPYSKRFFFHILLQVIATHFFSLLYFNYMLILPLTTLFSTVTE